MLAPCWLYAQVSAELKTVVQRLYYETLQRLDSALQNVCSSFTPEAYSKVSNTEQEVVAWQQQFSANCRHSVTAGCTKSSVVARLGPAILYVHLLPLYVAAHFCTIA